MSKEIQTIIAFLDEYLLHSGQISINPVLANKVLAKAGLLLDNPYRPGKPFRDLLRDGQIPHAFQSGSKGSVWIIPHSGKQKTELVAKNASQTKIKQPLPTLENQKLTNRITPHIEKKLLNEKDFKSAGAIDGKVPNAPGVYCIRIYDYDKLPKPFNKLMKERQHNIIYIGIATKSLSSRLLGQELRAKGHGTFFRSIGAVLGHQPPKGSLILKANKRNYKFAPTDEHKIIDWINTNLALNWVECDLDFEELESELISKHKPLVNIANNPAAVELLMNLRRKCVERANEI